MRCPHRIAVFFAARSGSDVALVLRIEHLRLDVGREIRRRCALRQSVLVGVLRHGRGDLGRNLADALQGGVEAALGEVGLGDGVRERMRILSISTKTEKPIAK